MVGGLGETPGRGVALRLLASAMAAFWAAKEGLDGFHDVFDNDDDEDLPRPGWISGRDVA